MVGLAGFGAMTAALSSGARISTERALGWNRHLRITPLTARAYLSTKVLTAYTLNNPKVMRLQAPLNIAPEVLDEVVVRLSEAVAQTEELIEGLEVEEEE